MLTIDALLNGLPQEFELFLHMGLSTTTIFGTNTILVVLFYRPNRHRVNMMLLGTIFFGGATWFYAVHGIHEQLYELNLSFIQSKVPPQVVNFFQLFSLPLLLYSIFLVILFLSDAVKRLQHRHQLGKESLLFGMGEVVAALAVWTFIIGLNSFQNLAFFLELTILLGVLATILVLVSLLINPNVAFVEYLVMERILTKKTESENLALGFALYHVGSIGPEILLAEIPPHIPITCKSHLEAIDILEEIGIKSMTQTGIGSEYGDSVHRFNLESPIKGSFIFLTAFGTTKSNKSVNKRLIKNPYLGFTFFVTDSRFEWVLDRTDAWKRAMTSLKNIPLEEITNSTLVQVILDALQYIITGSL